MFVCLAGCLVWFAFTFSRQDFSVKPWLYWNLLCRPGWLQTQRSTLLFFPNAGNKGMCHHAQPDTFWKGTESSDLLLEAAQLCWFPKMLKVRENERPPSKLGEFICQEVGLGAAEARIHVMSALPALPRMLLRCPGWRSRSGNSRWVGSVVPSHLSFGPKSSLLSH